MENSETIALDSTVRSQDSGKTNNSKDSSESKDSKTESCQDSKHSKEVLISERQQRQHQAHHQHHQQQQQQQHQQQQQLIRDQEHREKIQRAQERDDTNILMFTSCGQLLLGVVLVVFGVLVLVHGASLGGSGAGLWAGAGALVAGALGVVATLATSTNNKIPQQRAPGTSGFATAHLASSLVALALSNMSAITALTAVVRDSQRSTEPSILLVPGDDGNLMEVEGGWAGLLASIGLLIASLAELIVAGYSCVTLTPKLCGCLKSNNDDPDNPDGRLKTKNMVHQWVVAQNHVPKNQPIYVVQPVMPMHPIIQAPYGIPPPTSHGKYPPGFLPAGALPLAGPGYGPLPVMPHIIHASRPPSQMVRTRHHSKRHSQLDHETEERNRRHNNNNSELNRSMDSTGNKKMASIGEDQIDLAQTYTGLDKRISEEFISIAMDPDRKSKASSHHGSDIGSASKRTC